jgi:hypothetical protein
MLFNRVDSFSPKLLLSPKILPTAVHSKQKRIMNKKEWEHE